MIPYGRQDIIQVDIDSVVDVLKSDFLTQGPKVPEFERAVADKVGADFAIAVNSATSALHIACLSLGLGVGDWLWTSPITFVASANCGVYCGAQVDFVDIDPRTYNISPSALEAKLIKAEQGDQLPKVLVVVHLCGQPCEMETIHILAKKYGVRVIEDASHAIGGKYRGEYIGNCRYSDITVFSYHPVKIITTAEGGMALTNDSSLANQMALLQSHGVTRDTELMSHEPDGPWCYQQVELGYNYRMTELQAALGLVQLERLDDYIHTRHKLTKRYAELLEDQPLILPWQHQDSYSAFHLYVVQLKSELINTTRLEVFKALREGGVGVNVHYIPVYKQPYYQQFGYLERDYPNAEGYYSNAVTLPLYPLLTENEQLTVVKTLIEAINR